MEEKKLGEIKEIYCLTPSEPRGERTLKGGWVGKNVFYDAVYCKLYFVLKTNDGRIAREMSQEAAAREIFGDKTPENLDKIKERRGEMSRRYYSFKKLFPPHKSWLFDDKECLMRGWKLENPLPNW